MKQKKTNYDVIIIGAGISAIGAAIELVKESSLDVFMLEQGKQISDRKCPIITKETKKCINCSECAIMKGFGGAGSFSDGKYNITTEFGGWLTDYLPDEEVIELIKYFDSILMVFGATDEVFDTNCDEALKIKKEALKYDLHLLQAKVKHLGTENNLEILKNIYDFIKKFMDISCESKVKEITVDDDMYTVSYDDSKGNIEYATSKYIIVAPGRAGAQWFSKQCEKLDIPLINNQIDIGVRVETPYEVFENITQHIYEAKLAYITKCHGDKVRTFCMNPYGHVVTENVDGLVTVNGHSYSDEKFRSKNTNFAILVSIKFTEPFKKPYEYGKSIASLSNMLGEGVLVQRYGDLKNGERTTDQKLKKNFMKPTLNASPGDLSLVLPKRIFEDIIEMLEALNNITPGMINSDTLLYGVEVKFYSARPELSDKLETKYQNMFAIGDGAGITRGLAQAAASGIHVAREILNRIK